jgi:hypothetical protein
METLKDKIDKALVIIDVDIVDEHYELFIDYALWILYGVEVDYTKYSVIRTPKYFKFLLKELKPHINFIL